MTTATLKRNENIIEVYDGYDRIMMFDDGRHVKEGCVPRIRSKYVWIDEENGIYYLSLIDAYEDRNGRKIK